MELTRMSGRTPQELVLHWNKLKSERAQFERGHLALRRWLRKSQREREAKDRTIELEATAEA